MTRIPSWLIVLIVGVLCILGGRAISAQDRYTLNVPGGLAFAEFRGYEDWQTIAVSQSGQKIETILGNPAMIEAYKSGIPGNGKPFPDGAKMTKIHWTARKAEDEPGEPLVPGALHDVDFMVKDSKRFADSGGWGWAVFEYDPASETFRPGDASRHAAAGARREVRVRLPYDRGGQRLRFHCVSEAVKTARRQRVSPLPPRSRSIKRPWGNSPPSAISPFRARSPARRPACRRSSACPSRRRS